MTERSVTILGAGIVGICCAIACRRRGIAVTLIDASPPASETSAGNSGVICNCGFHPLASPALLRQTPRLLTNRDSRFLVRYRALPSLMPWMRRFAGQCNASDFERNTAHMITLTRDALPRHQRLMNEAGIGALLQPTGWLKLFRDQSAWQDACRDVGLLYEAGVETEVLDAEALRALEPDLQGPHRYGLWMKNTHTVSDPAALCRGYFELFIKLGGRFEQRRIRTITGMQSGWQLEADEGALQTPRLIIALGAWANNLLEAIGLKLPIIQERGYHLMFDYPDNRRLGRSIVDPERGYVVTPMASGLRVTSAANPVAEESEADPRQLNTLLPEVRETFALGPAQMETPWMGRRPSTPDSMPLIGSIDNKPNLIAATGHGHLGLTLAPVTGDLVAELVDGVSNPLIRPFSPDRLR